MLALVNSKKTKETIKAASYFGKAQLVNTFLSTYTVWEIEGLQGNRCLRAAFFGTQTFVKNVCDVLFDSVRLLRSTKSLNYGSAVKEFHRLSLTNFDLVGIEHAAYKADSGSKNLWLQAFMDTSVELETSFEDYLQSKMTKRMRTAVRKSMREPYGIDLKTDLKSLETFYEKLLVPYAQKIHGENSSVPSLSEILKKRRKLKLLRLSYEGKTVAGSLLLENTDRSMLRIWRHGIDPEVLKDSVLRGSISRSLDAHAVRFACEEKIPNISFGLVPSYEANGLVKNKKAWGCQFVPMTYSSFFELRTNELVKRWLLSERSVIFLEKSDSVLQQEKIVVRGDL